MSFHVIGSSPAENEVKKRIKNIIEQFKTFSFDFFVSNLHLKRTLACDAFFTKNRLKLNHLLGVNYLLVLLSKNKSWGTSTNEENFEVVWKQFVEEYTNVIFIEDLDSKNYLISTNNEVFILKYLNSISESFKVLGIADEKQIDPAKVETFYSIDKQATTVTPSNAYDFENMYKKYFFLVKILCHVFKLRDFISRIHKYSGKTSDFAVLFSLWTLSKPAQIKQIDEVKLKNIFDGTISKNHLSGNFDDFKKEYTSGEQLAPILTFDGKWYRFDYVSLFLFLLYLFSLNKKIEGTQTLSGLRTLDDQNQKAANVFEKTIRDLFRSKGYDVRPKEGEKYILKFNDQSYEFDCFAINESRKIIVLAEAKYEEFSPSSKAAINLVKQEVLDEDTGIIQYAMRHDKRRDCVINNFEKFNFDSKNPADYKIISTIVTKHMSVIQKYKNTRILSYEEFTNYDFNK